MPNTFLVRGLRAGRPMRARNAASSPLSAPVMGMAGSLPVLASTALTAPAFSSRASAGYSEPNETPERVPTSSASSFFSW